MDVFEVAITFLQFTPFPGKLGVRFKFTLKNVVVALFLWLTFVKLPTDKGKIIQTC